MSKSPSVAPGTEKPARTSSSVSSSIMQAYRRSTSLMSASPRADTYVPVPPSILDTKACVVIELGFRYTRIGFAGEYYPREILRSEVLDPDDDTVQPVFADGRTDEEEHRFLHLFFRKIFFKYILCSVKERRMLIVESLLTSTKKRNRVASVLFETSTFTPPAILFAPSHLLHTIPFSVNTALVVDVGFSETVLVPVYEGVTMINNYECSPVSSRLLEDHIAYLLKEHGAIELENGEHRKITDDDITEMRRLNILEDIAVRVCFATKIDRGQRIQEDKVDFEVAVESRVGFVRNTIVIPGIVREGAAEIFFKPSHCDDDRSVPELILDCVMRLPIDMRRSVISNLAIVGGAARMTGFMARMKAELKWHLQENARYSMLSRLGDSIKFYIHREAPVEFYSAWLGGSLLASLDIMQFRSTTREEWLKSRTLPDWTEKIDSYLKTDIENAL
uniref:Actin-related protein 10 n=1 Tax=Steinernema glaseri TaxID=37863 RepID=A0A1I7YP21_9BILA